MRRRRLVAVVAVLLGEAAVASALATKMWDESKGVYVGSIAHFKPDFEVPKPLWVFGYASLIWRPEAGWETFVAKRGKVKGWSRWFCQRSMDHRGTPESPGLVCSLLPDAPSDDDRPPSETVGVAYLVPDDLVDSVLESLDFREKGGYSREVATVTLLEGGEEVRALVYSASVENPNYVDRFVSPNPAALDEAAEIIAKSTGPSGPNAEYLLKLADAVKDDAYLQSLAILVRSKST